MLNHKVIRLVRSFSRLVRLPVTLTLDLVKLASLEAQLAMQSIGKMIILLVMAWILLTVTWLSLMGLLLWYLLNWSLSWPLAVLVIFLINLLLAIVTLLGAKAYGKHLTFPNTCRQLTLF